MLESTSKVTGIDQILANSMLGDPNAVRKWKFVQARHEHPVGPDGQPIQTDIDEVRVVWQALSIDKAMGFEKARLASPQNGRVSLRHLWQKLVTVFSPLHFQ